MTELQSILCVVTIALPLLGALLILVVRRPSLHATFNLVAAIPTGCTALALAALALLGHGGSFFGGWLQTDTIGAPFLAVAGIVGLCAAVISPAFLRSRHETLWHTESEDVWYYVCFHIFWAALLALPMLGNLGAAWVVIAATTGVSTLLVAQSGYATALEACWKYLLLTTVGLAISLYGIVIICAAAHSGHSLTALSWENLAAAAARMPHDTALTGFLLIIVGLATKIGWAPVHNWLPDAHSEAPPPVSALLSAALLPNVMLVAWRVWIALDGALTPSTGRAFFLGFGLISLAVAVPFLWRRMAWKRLLAYSSLENMGILALGIGFGHPLAIAGVLLHVAGHAVAKTLGFSVATPLLQVQPSARYRHVHGLRRSNPQLANAMSLSVGALSGLPPSPLFFSEVLIVAGGFAAGHTVAAALAAVLLALGFLGLSRVLVDDLMAPGRQSKEGDGDGGRAILALSVTAGVLLIALAASVLLLPGWDTLALLAGALP